MAQIGNQIIRGIGIQGLRWHGVDAVTQYMAQIRGIAAAGHIGQVRADMPTQTEHRVARTAMVATPEQQAAIARAVQAQRCWVARTDAAQDQSHDQQPCKHQATGPNQRRPGPETRWAAAYTDRKSDE